MRSAVNGPALPASSAPRVRRNAWRNRWWAVISSRFQAISLLFSASLTREGRRKGHGDRLPGPAPPCLALSVIDTRRSQQSTDDHISPTTLDSSKSFRAKPGPKSGDSLVDSDCRDVMAIPARASAIPPSVVAVMVSLRTRTPSTIATTGSRYVTIAPARPRLRRPEGRQAPPQQLQPHLVQGMQARWHARRALSRPAAHGRHAHCDRGRDHEGTHAQAWPLRHPRRDDLPARYPRPRQVHCRWPRQAHRQGAGNQVIWPGNGPSGRTESARFSGKRLWPARADDGNRTRITRLEGNGYRCAEQR